MIEFCFHKTPLLGPPPRRGGTVEGLALIQSGPPEDVVLLLCLPKKGMDSNVTALTVIDPWQLHQLASYGNCLLFAGLETCTA